MIPVRFGAGVRVVLHDLIELLKLRDLFDEAIARHDGTCLQSLPDCWDHHLSPPMVCKVLEC